jgi:hypothetical protein
MTYTIHWGILNTFTPNHPKEYEMAWKKAE